MGLISPTLPVIGQQRGDGEVNVRSTLVALLNEFNGNIESANVKDGSIQAADLASGVIKAKTYPATVIATAEVRTNAAYGLMTTPDRVQNVVVPTNGLLAVWYQATWQESVVNAANAAVFIGTNQTKRADGAQAAPLTGIDAQVQAGGAANVDRPLATWPAGLISGNANSAYTGDVTTGQMVGITNSSAGNVGGPAWYFVAAGTYDVSVQFKASSGNVVAKNRKLWCAVLDFS